MTEYSPEVLEVLGVAEVLGGNVRSQLAIADLVKAGLPLSSLELVKGAVGLTNTEVAELIGVNRRTISRLSKKKVPLGTVPSDRLYRLASVFAMAKDVLEDEDFAREWLRTPQHGLGHRVPLDLLNTEAGAREVEALLGRLEYGVMA